MKYTTWTVVKLKTAGRPWQVIAQYKDNNGKWRHKTKVLRQAQGKKEAEKLAEVWFNELNKAAEGKPNLEDTVSSIFYKFLEEQFSKRELEASTKYKQETTIRNLIDPFIGDLGFSTVDREDISRWITALHNKGYKQGTIYNAFQIANKVYKYYFTIGEINHNPCMGFKIKRGDPKQSHMSEEQLNNFIACVNLEYEPEEAMYSALFLAAFAALRSQEILGLRWRDIDFTTGMINITSAVGNTLGGDYLKNPKNRTSARSFPMVPQLVDVLFYRYQKIKPKPSWFVVGDEDHHMTLSSFRNKFTRFRDAYELDDIYGQPLSSHMLRHNVGMMGIKSGMDISSLSRMFGHSSRAMTLDRYGDASPDAARVASEKLSKIIKKSELDE